MSCHGCGTRRCGKISKIGCCKILSKENCTVLSRFQQIQLQETFWFQFLPPVFKVISVFPEMLIVWGYTAKKKSIWPSGFWLPDVTFSWLNKPNKTTVYGWDYIVSFQGESRLLVRSKLEPLTTETQQSIFNWKCKITLSLSFSTFYFFWCKFIYR